MKFKHNFGLGTGDLGSLGRGLDVPQVEQLLQKAIELNIAVVDTADAYGCGRAEYLLGAVLNNSSMPFFIITKAATFYVPLPLSLNLLAQLCTKPIKKLRKGRSISSDYIERSLRRSCKRLGVSKVDAFLLHDLSEKSWGDGRLAKASLENISTKNLAGLVGVSSDDVALLRRLSTDESIQVIQTAMPYCAVRRQILETAKSRGCMVVVNQIFRPLADKRLVQKLDALCKEFAIDGSPYRILAAYCNAQSFTDVVLMGTKKPERLVENLEPLSGSECSGLLDRVHDIFS